MERTRAARRLTDVQRKRHRVPHLPRLRQRREQLDLVEIGPQVALAAAPADERARQIGPCVVRIDEGEHRREWRLGRAGAPCGGGKVEQPARVRINHADPDRAARPIGRQFHPTLPLRSAISTIRRIATAV